MITGGDSGIGRAVAIAYAREGADVLIAYLNEDEDAAEVARYITNCRGSVEQGLVWVPEGWDHEVTIDAAVSIEHYGVRIRISRRRFGDGVQWLRSAETSSDLRLLEYPLMPSCLARFFSSGTVQSS